MKMKVMRSSETSVHKRAARRHIPFFLLVHSFGSLHKTELNTLLIKRDNELDSRFLELWELVNTFSPKYECAVVFRDFVMREEGMSFILIPLIRFQQFLIEICTLGLCDVLRVA